MFPQTLAVLDSNSVVISVATYAEQPVLPDGHTTVRVPDGMYVVPGDLFTGETFEPKVAHTKELRAERDRRITDVVWMLDRHAQEDAMGIAHKLSEADYIALLKYIQALRDLPQTCTGFNDVTWPVFSA